MMTAALSDASRSVAFLFISLAQNQCLSFRCFGIEIMDHPAQYAVELLSRSAKFLAILKPLIPLFLISMIDSSLVLEKKM